MFAVRCSLFALLCILSSPCRAQSPHCCSGGLFAYGDVEAYQAAPGRVNVEGLAYSCPCTWYWVDRRWAFLVFDIGQPCPFVGGYSWRAGNGPGIIKASDVGVVLHGSCGGMPWDLGGVCDFNLDGRITAGDLFGFIAAMVAGDGIDWNLDGVVDNRDFFDFLDAFMGGADPPAVQ